MGTLRTEPPRKQLQVINQGRRTSIMGKTLRNLIALMILSIFTLYFLSLWGDGEVYFIQSINSKSIFDFIVLAPFDIAVFSPIIYGVYILAVKIHDLS